MILEEVKDFFISSGFRLIYIDRNLKLVEFMAENKYVSAKTTKKFCLFLVKLEDNKIFLSFNFNKNKVWNDFNWIDFNNLSQLNYFLKIEGFKPPEKNLWF